MSDIELVELEQNLDRSIAHMWTHASREGIQGGIYTDYLVDWFLQALEIDTALAAGWER